MNENTLGKAGIKADPSNFLRLVFIFVARSLDSSDIAS